MSNNFCHIKTEKSEFQLKSYHWFCQKIYVPESYVEKAIFFQSFKFHLKTNFSMWLHNVFNNSGQNVFMRTQVAYLIWFYFHMHGFDEGVWQ